MTHMTKRFVWLLAFLACAFALPALAQYNYGTQPSNPSPAPAHVAPVTPPAPVRTMHVCLADALKIKNAGLKDQQVAYASSTKAALATFHAAIRDAQKTHTEAIRAISGQLVVDQKTANDARRTALKTALDAFHAATASTTDSGARVTIRDTYDAARDKAQSDFDLAMAHAQTDAHLKRNQAMLDWDTVIDNAQSNLDATRDRALTDSHIGKAKSMDDFHVSVSACHNPS
jgi:hypothetical protein